MLKIRHITRTSLAITLFVTALTAAVPSGHAVSWYSDTQLTTDPVSDYTPAITQTQDGKVWVLWNKVPLIGSADIYYRTYDGAWSTTDIPLTTDSGNDVNPAVLQSRDGKFWLFWTSDRTGNTGYYKIFYKTSSDNGQTWSDDSQLTYEAKYLYVNYYDDTITGNWTRTVDSPYLATIDYPINYINQTTESTMGSIGNFHFEDLTLYASEKLYIEIYTRQIASENDALDAVEVWLYDESLSLYTLVGTLTPDTTWSWKSTSDVSSLLNTLSKVNAAKAYLVKKTNGAPQNIEIDAMRIKIDLGIDRRPSVMQAADGKIWVVWYTRRTGNNELFCKVFDGIAWSDDTQLTYDLSSDWEPSIIQALDGKIWVFWSSFRTGDYEIFYKTSTDNGASWSSDTPLTISITSWDEAPAATQTRDGKILVAWQADRSGKDYDLYYKIYDGSSWSSDTALVNYRLEDQFPSIFQAENKSLWVGWSSSRADDFDIFYKLSIPDMHDGGITSVTPSQTVLYRGYENPVQISVDLWNYGLSQDTFTVTLYRDITEIGVETITLVSNTMTTLNFTWNTSSLSLGYYSLHAEVDVVPGEIDISDNNFTDGTISLTFAGDSNGDGRVDASDLFDLSKTYGLDTSGSELNPECDFNGDGKTDVSDLFDLGRNYGKSF